MPQKFDPVFNNWYTGKCLGNGTDGRVYEIEREIYDKKQKSVLKTIRISDNRNESKSFNSINDIDAASLSDDFLKIIDDITTNIETIKEVDAGKHFAKYEEWDVRDTSDNKGKIILIRMEELRSLTNLLDRFSFTYDETLKLGICVCKALCRCRDFGYVYPNLKPENIMFDKNGVCKLGDFGSFSSLEPAKSSVAFKKTQYYMAPEFIKTGKINCTCDTYSLGLVLYMLLNRGKLPFCEDVTVSALNHSMESRCKGLAFTKPETGSEELFNIIQKACAFKAEERYLSPKQMLADLKAVLQNKPCEDVLYDDIYSSSSLNADAEDNFVNDEDDEYVKYSEAVDPFKEEVKLHEEISIPDISPADYGSNNAPVRKKRPVSYSRLADLTTSKNKNTGNIKAILGIIIAMVAVFVLLIISISLRLSVDDTLLDDNLTNVYINFIGVIFNGC